MCFLVVKFQVKHPDGSVDSVSDIEKATAITLPDVVQWLHIGVATIYLQPHIQQVFLEVEKTWNNIDSGFAVMYVTDTDTLILIIVVLQELGRAYNLVIMSSIKQPRPSGTYFSTWLAVTLATYSKLMEELL
jgi:hypothetical protein